MSWILEVKGLRLHIKDESFLEYDALELMIAEVKKKFGGTTMCYSGIVGLCFMPYIEIRRRSLRDFKNLLTNIARLQSFRLTKRGRAVIEASAEDEVFRFTYDGQNHTISINSLESIHLDVLPAKPAEQAA